MKRQICLIIAAIMLFGTMITFAQKPFKGTISYSFSAKNNTDPTVAAQLASQKADITIMGNFTKTVVNATGIGVISISNGDNKTAVTVIDIPGMGKYYAEQDAKTVQSNFEKVKIDFNYTDEAKNIAGYNCKKCIVTITDLETSEENSIATWTTTELLTGENINFATYPGLKGFPMETEITQELATGDKLTIIQSASAVTFNKKLKAAAFTTPKDAKPLSEAPEEIRTALQQMLGID